jgi:hypothetical protein
MPLIGRVFNSDRVVDLWESITNPRLERTENGQSVQWLVPVTLDQEPARLSRQGLLQARDFSGFVASLDTIGRPGY